MNLQWTVISGFLGLEIIVAFFLALPFVSSSSWRVVFQSGLVKTLSGYANYVFTIFFVLLTIVFADSIREMMKFSHTDEDEASMSNNPNAVNQVHMLLYRAQRNFLLAGFSLFLCLVNWRLMKLISSEATLSASEQAAIKQAKSASEAAKRLMEDQDKKPDTKKEEEKNAKQELDEVKKELRECKDSLKAREADLVAIKKQAESTNREYDRLTSEYQKLQSQVDSADDKKSS